MSLAVAGLLIGHASAATMPQYQITADYTEGIHSAVFGRDGSTAYCTAHTYPINIWAIFVHFWPELLGAVVGIVTLIAGWIVLRAFRRPRRQGVPYCRVCNYDLTGQSGATCPECGCDTAKRSAVVGKRLGRRIAWPCVMLFLLAGSYSALWICHIPRSNPASRWIQWPSTGLPLWAHQHQIDWLKQFMSYGEEILRVDLATGATSRLGLRLDRTYMNLSVTPDGRSLVVAVERGLVLMDTVTGHEHGGITLPAGLVDVEGAQVLGYSKDGTTAYVQWFDEANCVSGVSAWTLATGELKVLTRTTAYTDNSTPSRPAHYSRKYVRIGQEEPPRFVSVPHFMESFGTKVFEVRVHGDGEEITTRYQLTGASHSAQPVITPDGSKMFLCSLGAAVMGVEPRSGESLGLLSANSRVWDSFALDDSGNGLVVSGTGAIHVRDVQAKKWTEEYILPQGTFSPRPQISYDGKWLLATCQLPIPAGQSIGSYNSHELVLWRVPDQARPAIGEKHPAAPPH